METRDLDSYYPGYDEYCEDRSKVPFEDYRELEDKLEIYEKIFEELEELINDSEQYTDSKKVVLSKAIIEDLRRKLC